MAVYLVGAAFQNKIKMWRTSLLRQIFVTKPEISFPTNQIFVVRTNTCTCNIKLFLRTPGGKLFSVPRVEHEPKFENRRTYIIALVAPKKDFLKNFLANSDTLFSQSFSYSHKGLRLMNYPEICTLMCPQLKPLGILCLTKPQPQILIPNPKK